MGTWSAAEISELSQYLGGVEDWLRASTARHADDMAAAVGKACCILEDLYDEQLAAERADVSRETKSEHR